MFSISERYRLKAVSCEKLGHDAEDHDVKRAWGDIAIEWHTLAYRMAEFEPTRPN